MAGLLPDGTYNGNEILKHCPGVLTTCMGGTLPGYTEWWYTGIVTLPMKCNYWAFSVLAGTRNNVTNINPYKLWTEATLDNLHFEGDSSPYFTVKPIPYVCNNVPYIYNNGPIDVNSDSLSFEVHYPSGANCGDPYGTSLDSQWAPLPIGAPYYNLFNNPLQCNNTFIINHCNGQMGFTPQDFDEKAAISLFINSYRSGSLIGHVMRELQIVVRECNNIQPDLNIISNSVTGGFWDNSPACVTGIKTCSGNVLHFSFLASSPDTLATLAIADNHLLVSPNASISYSNYGTDSVVGNYTWAINPLDTGLKVLTLSVWDSSCRSVTDVNPQQTYTLPIYVLPQPHINQDTIICLGDTVHLSVVGVDNFNWTTGYGADTNSLSCTRCSNPIAKPSQSTQYIVTSNVSPICKNKDDVFIEVVQIPIVNAGVDRTIPIGDTVHLFGSAMPRYITCKYHWSPATAVDSPDNQRPTFTDTVSQMMLLTATNAAGCAATDTVNITVQKANQIPLLAEPAFDISVANILCPALNIRPEIKILTLSGAILKSFVIYNQFGVKVFESNDIRSGWDGSYNGQQQTTGIYFYEVEVQTNKGQSVYKHGKIIIVK